MQAVTLSGILTLHDYLLLSRQPCSRPLPPSVPVPARATTLLLTDRSLSTSRWIWQTQLILL